MIHITRKYKSIDGVRDGVDNGWAYHWRLEEVEAMYVCHIHERVISHRNLFPLMEFVTGWILDGYVTGT